VQTALHDGSLAYMVPWLDVSDWQKQAAQRAASGAATPAGSEESPAGAVLALRDISNAQSAHDASGAQAGASEEQAASARTNTADVPGTTAVGDDDAVMPPVPDEAAAEPAAQLPVRVAALEAKLAAEQASRAALAAQLQRTQSAAQASDAAHAAQLADAEARAAALEAQLARTQRNATHSAHNAAAVVRIKRERAEDAEAAAKAAARARDESVAARERMRRDAARSARSAAALLAEAQDIARVNREEAEHATAAAAAAEVAERAALRELEDETECKICLERQRDTRFFQCGHRFCAVCGPKQEHCPFGCCEEKVRGGPGKQLRTVWKPRLEKPERVW
jgi:hypothetical protein